MASCWTRKFRGTIVTVTLLCVILCITVRHLFLVANDDELDTIRHRRDQVVP